MPQAPVRAGMGRSASVPASPESGTDASGSDVSGSDVSGTDVSGDDVSGDDVSGIDPSCGGSIGVSPQAGKRAASATNAVAEAARSYFMG